MTHEYGFYGSPDSDSFFSRERVFYGGIGAAGLALLSLIAWGFMSHDEPGSVTAKTWTRTATVQTWGQATRAGWLDADHLSEQPHVDPIRGSGERAGVENLRDCHREQRTTERVRSGSHQECHTASNLDLIEALISTAEARAGGGNSFHGSPPRSSPSRSSGSGSSRPHVPVTTCRTVTDYVTIPVYDEKCTYDTWVWDSGFSKTLTGEGASIPVWPTMEVGDLQRELRKDAYTVTFTSSVDADHTLTMEGEGVFSEWAMGDGAVLRVTNFGTVSSVERAP